VGVITSILYWISVWCVVRPLSWSLNWSHTYSSQGQRSHAENSQGSGVQLEGIEAGCWYRSLLARSPVKNRWTTLMKRENKFVWCFCLRGRLMRARTGLCVCVCDFLHLCIRLLYEDHECEDIIAWFSWLQRTVWGFRPGFGFRCVLTKIVASMCVCLCVHVPVLAGRPASNAPQFAHTDTPACCPFYVSLSLKTDSL